MFLPLGGRQSNHARAHCTSLELLSCLAYVTSFPCSASNWTDVCRIQRGVEFLSPRLRSCDYFRRPANNTISVLKMPVLYKNDDANFNVTYPVHTKFSLSTSLSCRQHLSLHLSSPRIFTHWLLYILFSSYSSISQNAARSIGTSLCWWTAVDVTIILWESVPCSYNVQFLCLILRQKATPRGQWPVSGQPTYKLQAVTIFLDINLPQNNL